jgi:hypothetical protein
VIDGLTQAQAVALLRKHLTGDASGHDWRTIQVLLRKGLLAEDGKNLVVTPAGKAWCDKHHMRVGV